MTTPIPQLRTYLLDIAEVLHVVLDDGDLRSDVEEIIDNVRLDLLWIETQAWRRKGIRARAPTSSPRMTRALSRKLRRDALAHPEKTQQQIAEPYGVNGGRVNEALNGRLKPVPKPRPRLTGMSVKVSAEHLPA
jgi:hypothetical protein